MTKQSAAATVEVAADPLTAFQVFTDEIDLWWVRGPINFFDSARAIEMRIEPGVGGRILEIYARGEGTAVEDALELGRITVWEPGARLGYRSSVDDTETSIAFEAVEAGTRVTVEQVLLPGGKQAFYMWPNVIVWLPTWIDRRDTAPRTTRDLDRISMALYYEDPAAAARWLSDVFGLDSWDRVPAEGERAPWLELHIGNSALILFKLKDHGAPRLDHGLWVYVDDLDAHFARSTEQGAKIVSEIHQHGYRRYEAQDLEGHHWTFAQARPTMA